MSNTFKRSPAASPKSQSPLVDVRSRTADGTTELYITARPAGQGNFQKQSPELMEAVADVLRQHRAHILQERIFATAEAMPSLIEARRQFFDGLQDGIEPTCLVVPENSRGAISGVQVHAVSGCQRPGVVMIGRRPAGRLLPCGGGSFLVGCNLQADEVNSPAQQSQAMLAKAEALLAHVGASLADVARTWMWLGDILSWYGEFNRVRNELFAARGLLGPDSDGEMPASTGIGIGPLGDRRCTMDFCAAFGQERPRFLLATGRQGAASKYGSAFSRGAVARTLGGKTLYISGTAAIDAAGATTHIDDAGGQIHDTIQAVGTVLREGGADWADVVQAIVYCKTPEVEQAFRQHWGQRPLPHLTAIADVCRDNLLFEIEATAMLPDGQPQ